MGGEVGGGSLRACSGGGSWLACGVFRSLTGGSSNGCLSVFSRSFRC